LSSIAELLQKLLRKGNRWIWKEEQSKTFQKLKDLISQAPVLGYPNFSKPFVLYTDASDVGIGAVLLQEQGGNSKFIRHLSLTLNPDERNYSASERECLATVHALTSFKPYLLGTDFTVMTDCKALSTMREKANFDSRIIRWVLLLEQSAFGIKYVKGHENLSDSLSRIDMSDMQSRTFSCHVGLFKEILLQVA
jgi:hypothetical protein